jgi:hypothetical protein
VISNNTKKERVFNAKSTISMLGFVRGCSRFFEQFFSLGAILCVHSTLLFFIIMYQQVNNSLRCFF